MSTDRMLHRELSESIIGAAMQVLNTLHPGLKEKAYENALAIELSKRGHHIEQQRRYDVVYDETVVDTLVPDLIVNDAVIVDAKTVDDFTRTHEAQMIGYLTITGKRLALLLNFKFSDLRWKRIVR